VKTESIAVLKWVPSTLLADGEEAVVAALEESLRDAAAAAGLTATGTLKVRQIGIDEYPHMMSVRPSDDPGALLHMAELIFD